MSRRYSDPILYLFWFVLQAMWTRKWLLPSLWEFLRSHGRLFWLAIISDFGILKYKIYLDHLVCELQDNMWLRDRVGVEIMMSRGNVLQFEFRKWVGVNKLLNSILKYSQLSCKLAGCSSKVPGTLWHANPPDPVPNEGFWAAKSRLSCKSLGLENSFYLCAGNFCGPIVGCFG